MINAIDKLDNFLFWSFKNNFQYLNTREYNFNYHQTLLHYYKILHLQSSHINDIYAFVEQTNV